MKIQTYRGQITLSKVDEFCPINNPDSDLHNFNAYTEFGENPLTFTQVIVRKRKYGRTERNLPISNPKADLHNINSHTKFGENPLIFSKVIVQK